MKKRASVRKQRQRGRDLIGDRKRMDLSCSTSWELITSNASRLSAVFKRIKIEKFSLSLSVSRNTLLHMICAITGPYIAAVLDETPPQTV
jgi:hypothetical protein